MNSFHYVTPNQPARSATPPQLPFGPMNTGYTPVLITTHSNGMQTMSAVPVLGSPTMPGMLPVVLDSNGLPVGPLMMTQPSNSPLPALPVFLPSPLTSQSPSLNLPMDVTSNGSMMQLPVYDNVPSLSREREDLLEDIQPFESERAQEPAEAVRNESSVPIPTLTEDMTKKDLVNATLDWFYEVLGSDHFDCEGRRGANVLRVKVKTRGALEYICVFIKRCIQEELLHYVSCPLSKKKKRKYVRGYLAYLEGVSADATDRMIEIFNEINTVLVKNCDGILEHPFKGISRNPIPIRSRCNSLENQHRQMAA